MPMNMEAEKISPHFLSRFSMEIMPFCSFLPIRGTSQMPTMMLTVMTQAMVTYWVAFRLATWPKVRPMALSALEAAMVS